MKQLLGLLGTALCGVAFGQVTPGFISGQILTAAQLNAAFAQAVNTVNGQVSGLTVTTGLTATGLVTPTDLASQAANTVLANVTGTAASPTAIALPTGCNTAASALQYNTGSFTCGTVANAGANSNITSLTGLTTPLGTWAGGLGANNSTSTGVPVFSAGVVTVSTTPALGTPSAVTLTNGTGLPISTGVSGLGTGVATALGSAVTGSGGVVLATSPTITTPAIVGPTNGVSAGAGDVGEVICAQVTNGGTPTGCATNSSTPVSLATGITSNVTSITLTAGNWKVWGQVLTIPAGTTTQSVVNAAISPTSTSFTGQVAEFLLPFSAPAGAAVGGALTPMPIRVTTNTTYYLIVNSTFAVSTNTAIGFIVAQRTN